VDVREVRVRCGGDNRATLYLYSLVIDPPIPQASECEQLAVSNLKGVRLLDLAVPLAE
jgi:hypothetical protein